MNGRPDNKDHRAGGGNPCLEQTLESYELCCLVETFPTNHENLEDYKRTLKVRCAGVCAGVTLHMCVLLLASVLMLMLTCVCVCVANIYNVCMCSTPTYMQRPLRWVSGVCGWCWHRVCECVGGRMGV